MSDHESKSFPTGTQTVDSSGGVQRQLNLLQLGLIVLSAVFATYLWRQVKYARQDLQGLKQPAAFLVQSYNQEKPSLDAFLAKLVEFGRTNKNFVPILQKYQITAAPAAPAAAKPAPKPAASPAPAPKK